MQNYVHDIKFATFISSEDAEFHLKILFSWAVYYIFPLIHLNLNKYRKAGHFITSINPAASSSCSLQFLQFCHINDKRLTHNLTLKIILCASNLIQRNLCM